MKNVAYFQNLDSRGCENLNYGLPLRYAVQFGRMKAAFRKYRGSTTLATSGQLRQQIKP